jgi:DNA repair exonuclease SbcCD ATPase subunit
MSTAAIPEFIRSRVGADLGTRAAAAAGAARETLGDLRARIEQERGELNGLRSRIDAARSRLQGLLDQIRNLEAERDRLLGLVNRLQGQIRDLLSRGADVVPEALKRYYDQISSLESQIASVRARISALRAEIESLRRQAITFPPAPPTLPEDIASRIGGLEQRGRELFETYVRSPSRLEASAIEQELSRINRELVSLRQEYARALAPPPALPVPPAPPVPPAVPPELAASIARIGQLEQTIQQLFYEMLRQRDSTSMRELQDTITRLQRELEEERRRRAELEARLAAPPPAPPAPPAVPPAPPILAILARRPILGALVARWLPGYVAPPAR